MKRVEGGAERGEHWQHDDTHRSLHRHRADSSLTRPDRRIPRLSDFGFASNLLTCHVSECACVCCRLLFLPPSLFFLIDHGRVPTRGSTRFLWSHSSARQHGHRSKAHRSNFKRSTIAHSCCFHCSVDLQARSITTS